MIAKTAFITGASSGLGRGLALHYARAGATVHAAARRAPALEALCAEAEAGAAPGRVVPVQLDVLDTAALVAAMRRAEREAGGALDLVVANAGIGYTTPARDLDWEGVKRLLDVNVSAACVTVAAALPAMIARGQGTVAAVSSLAGFRGLPGNGAYSASKAALRTFMESLRLELRGTGVRALTICPGFVKTEMTARNRFPMPFLMELDDAVAAMVRGIERGEPLIAFPWPLAALVRTMAALPRGAYDRLAVRVRGRR